MISDLIEKELSSSGGKPFTVMVENDMAMANNKTVYVKIVVVNNKPLVKFGNYVKSEGRKTDFIEIEGFDSRIEHFLSNTIVGGIDFSPVIDMISGIDVEVNYNLRLINISRRIFKYLSKAIYLEGVNGNLESGNMKLGIDEINSLYNFFENKYVNCYLSLLNGTVERYVKNYSNIVTRTHLALRNFVLVMVSGKCIVNPLIDSYKMRRVFSQTDIYKTIMSGCFTLSEDCKVYLITNREICEGLHLSKYLRFNKSIFTYILLGLLNPNKYPNKDSKTLIDENGNMVRKGQELPSHKQVSTLYYMCRVSVDRSTFNRLDEYVDALGEARL